MEYPLDAEELMRVMIRQSRALPPGYDEKNAAWNRIMGIDLPETRTRLYPWSGAGESEIRAFVSAFALMRAASKYPGRLKPQLLWNVHPDNWPEAVARMECRWAREIWIRDHLEEIEDREAAYLAQLRRESEAWAAGYEDRLAELDQREREADERDRIDMELDWAKQHGLVWDAPRREWVTQSEHDRRWALRNEAGSVMF